MYSKPYLGLAGEALPRLGDVPTSILGGFQYVRPGTVVAPGSQ